MRHSRRLLLSLLTFSCVASLRAAEPKGLPAFNRARFHPAAEHERDMVGGKFTGSLVSPFTGFEVLAEIKDVPPAGQWSELTIPNAKVYRWVRYEAPAGSHGHVAELEFYAGERRLDGWHYGSIGESKGRTWRKATDKDVTTWFDSDTPDGQFVAIDLRERATAAFVALQPPPGDYGKPQTVTLKCPTPGASIRYTTDGTLPGPDSGTLYTAPLAIDATTTLVAASFKEGLAPSPQTFGTYLVDPSAKPGLNTLHVGNSLTNTTGRFALYAKSAGYRHVYASFTGPGAWTKGLWDVLIPQQKERWEKTLAAVPKIDHFTVQPRDFNVAEEAGYDLKFFDLVRKISPDVQPWLYCEWTERERRRPTDMGTVPSSQMTKLYPALTWEESMAGMLLYMEELQRKVAEIDKGGKRARIIPSALAMGWIKNTIDRGQFPGVAPGSFYPLLYDDGVHPNENGAYLVDLTWFAAFYHESPVGKVLPVGTRLTAEQAALMQHLAWDVVRNYPDCGLYEEGSTPAGKPESSPAASPIGGVTPVTLSSSTPGAWFRYTLDGTTPTKTNGYVYCGVVSVRPGMTLKAVAYKSGTADSPVLEASYAEQAGGAVKTNP